MADNEQCKRFAEAYVNGPPHTRGNWSGSSQAAGFTTIPRKNHRGIMRALHDLGVAPPPPPPSHVYHKAKKPEEVEADTGIPNAGKQIDVILSSMPDNADDAWFREAAKKLRPVMLQIARGELTVSPGQRMVLKDIMDRGFGKAGTNREEGERLLGVVVVPAIGQGPNTRICPSCGHGLD